MDLELLEKNIGYTFKNKDLLKQALRHTSYANERNLPSNEKLEFLGDSILEFITSKYIYKNYPNLREGEMTKVRATVVCGNSLSEVAKLHNFSDFLYLGKSEQKTGRKSKAILEDSIESMIAAIYLDGGIEPVEKFIIENLKEEINEATKHVGDKDYKTVLQEKLQERGNVRIEYKTIGESGPDHNKRFEADVEVNGKFLAKGKGKSKKEAQMQAAKKALENLN